MKDCVHRMNAEDKQSMLLLSGYLDGVVTYNTERCDEVGGAGGSWTDRPWLLGHVVLKDEFELTDMLRPDVCYYPVHAFVGSSNRSIE